MQIFIDSNIVGRYFDDNDLSHFEIKLALNLLTRYGHEIVYSIQVAAEFTSFGTRLAASNGFGLSMVEVEGYLDEMERMFLLRYARSTSEYRHFRKLLHELTPVGRKVHDLKLIATCMASGVRIILTYNDKDFVDALVIRRPHPRHYSR